MPLFLTEDDVDACLSMDEAIGAVDDAFACWARGDAANHARQRFFLPDCVLHHMAAALPAQRVMGTKTYATASSGTRFYVELYSSETGELLAMIEANRLGQLRTGAATGAAAKRMARPESAIAALLGTGFQASTQAHALVAALPHLRLVRVFGRDVLRREEFCRELTRATGVRFEPATSAEGAVRGADAVVCATAAREPILRGEWLHDGAFVAAVGANRLTAREIDETVVERAGVVAIDDPTQARAESAELIVAYERRKFVWEKAVAYAQIAAGYVSGRPSPTAITLFKSLGIALEDVAAAAIVYKNAVARGLGRELVGSRQ